MKIKKSLGNENPLLPLVLNQMPARLAAAVRMSWRRTPATLHGDLANEAYAAYLEAQRSGLPEADQLSAAENAMARLRRRRGPRRRRAHAHITAAPRPQAPVTLLKIAAEDPGWALTALRVLPPEHRKVAGLKFILNGSYKVVANEMGVTTSVARRLVKQAQRLLRPRLEELDSLHGILNDSIRARIIEGRSR
jgi:DNA-directed RNA polymerase specialized sigma24 family protein